MAQHHIKKGAHNKPFMLKIKDSNEVFAVIPLSTPPPPPIPPPPPVKAMAKHRTKGILRQALIRRIGRDKKRGFNVFEQEPFKQNPKTQYPTVEELKEQLCEMVEVHDFFYDKIDKPGTKGSRQWWRSKERHSRMLAIEFFIGRQEYKKIIMYRCPPEFIKQYVPDPPEVKFED